MHKGTELHKILSIHTIYFNENLKESFHTKQSSLVSQDTKQTGYSFLTSQFSPKRIFQNF